jgi:hypothetical protein
VIEVTLVTSRRLAPASYPAAVDVRSRLPWPGKAG